MNIMNSYTSSAGNFHISGNFGVRHAGSSPAGRPKGEEIQTEGGDGIVGTDQKSVQGLGFHGRQPGMGTLLP